MKKAILLLILFNIFSNIHSQITIEHTQVSILTESPGEELYSRFGHAAIRLVDTTSKLDVAVNWGMFDFSTPYFYAKFASGRLDYTISDESGNSFIKKAAEENRMVREQVLNLSNTEKEKLVNAINENFKPENRLYRYEYFYDNCATRIRDMVFNSMDSTYTINDSAYIVKTFRQHYSDYLADMHWIVSGIDILFGIPTDQEATVQNSMFLPDYMHDAFNWVVKSDGSKLVISDKVISEGTQTPISPDASNYPLITFSIIALIGFTLMLLSAKATYWFDNVLFSINGLLGLLVIVLMFVSNHLEMKNNLNLMWLFPTNLLFFIILKTNKIKKIYFLLFNISCIIILLSWFLLPQEINFAFFPLILYFAVRAFCISNNLDETIRNIIFKKR